MKYPMSREAHDAWIGFIKHQSEYHAMEAIKYFMQDGIPIPPDLSPYFDLAAAALLEKHHRDTRKAKDAEDVDDKMFMICELTCFGGLKVDEAVEITLDWCGWEAARTKTRAAYKKTLTEYYIKKKPWAKKYRDYFNSLDCPEEKKQALRDHAELLKDQENRDHAKAMRLEKKDGIIRAGG